MVGNAVYRVGESVVLTADTPAPGPEQSKQRGEGVAIVLTDFAVCSWRAGGEHWKAWSSRLITARHEVKPMRRGSSTQLHVLSYYIPTLAAKLEEKYTGSMMISNKP